MYIAFLIIMVVAIIVEFFAGRLENEKLMLVGLVLGIIAGIVLIIAIQDLSSSDSSTNPYFLGTFLLIMCAGIPFGIGYNLGQHIRKKKQ